MVNLFKLYCHSPVHTGIRYNSLPLQLNTVTSSNKIFARLYVCWLIIHLKEMETGHVEYANASVRMASAVMKTSCYETEATE